MKNLFWEWKFHLNKKKKKKWSLAKVIRESFTTLQMDCRHGREEGTCPRRALTLFSRILPSSVPIPPFESKAFTNYSPEFHSHPNTKIQNFNSRSPEFHSQKRVSSSPRKLSNFINFFFFFFSFFRSSIFTRFILSYLNSSSFIARNARGRSFFPKIFPLFDEATRFLP